MADRIVALVSGADSEVMTGELLSRGATVLPLYVRCGYRWEKAELAHLRKALKSLRHPRLKPLTVLSTPMRPLMGRHWSVTNLRVPGAGTQGTDAVRLQGRNVVLLTKAWLLAAARGADAVAIGTLKGNIFTDATHRFRQAMGRALNLGLSTKIKLLAPYIGLTKKQVFARAGRLRLELAFSCLAPRRGKHCGRCNKCAELFAALAELRRPFK